MNAFRGMIAGLTLLASIQSASAAISYTYQYTGGTPSECCGDFDTSNEASLIGVYGNGNLNNGAIGNDLYIDGNLGNGEYRSGNSFAYQGEGTPGAGTEFNGTYFNAPATIRVDFGSVQNNLGTLRIDYNTNPVQTFGVPNNVTITDDNAQSVTFLSSSFPAASDGNPNYQRGVYQFVDIDISSLSGQFLTISFGPTNQYVGINELTFEAVPEPGALTLLGCGAAAVVVVRRRRRS